jgi:hypothetical protein
MSTDDTRHRDAIAAMLDRWGLCDMRVEMPDVSSEGIKVVPYKEKPNWKLKAMYVVGKKPFKRERQDV